MKVKKLTTIILTLTFILSLTIQAFPNNLPNDSRLSDYITALDDLNNELNTDLKLPDDSSSIEIILKLTPDEFINSIRSQYEEVSNLPEDVKIDATSTSQINQSNDERLRSTIKTTAKQTVLLDYGEVFKKSSITDTTGTGNNFVYTNINSCGNHILSGEKYFQTNECGSVGFTAGSKTCKVKYIGTLISAEGLDLLVHKTYTVTYTAP